jgi:hypothetical protein
MTKAGDTGEDFIGRLGPREGLRRFVVDGEVAIDGRLEFAGAAVDAAPELLLRQQGEPALDQIDPGRALGREVQMVAGALREPPLDQGGLVRGVVVDDEMDVQVLGHRGVDRVQELPELDRPMPAMRWPITRPLCVSKAAKSDVVPWRR